MSLSPKLDYSQNLIPSYIDGAMLVANSIPDSGLIIRGSECVYEQFFQTFQHHDLYQQLITSTDNSRMRITHDPLTYSALGQEDLLIKKAIEIAKTLNCSIIFLGSRVRYLVTGEKIENLAHIINNHVNAACIPLHAGYDYNRDYHSVYKTAFVEMAKLLCKDTSKIRKHKTKQIGIVGNTFLRYEGDSVGNVWELQTLIEQSGCTVSSIWNSGQPWKQLKRIKNSDYLISFPNSQEAAQIIGNHFQCEIINLNLPISISEIKNWINTLASLSGNKHTHNYYQKQIRHIIPLLDPIISKYLLGKKAILSVAPEWINGLTQLLEEDFGIEIVGKIIKTIEIPEKSESPAATIWGLNNLLKDKTEKQRVDLIIGSTWDRRSLEPQYQNIPFVEFGYPSHLSHYIVQSPYIGFSGVLNWCQTLYNKLIVD